jgi:hypothetical protein
MKFFAYSSEQQMRDVVGLSLYEKILSTSIISHITVCTRNKSCIGSLCGKIYQYADGSIDTGIIIEQHRSVINDCIFTW